VTPIDYAKRIVRIETTDHRFVVSLANDSWRLPLSMGRSAQAADHVAFIGRQIVARQVAQALADEDCRVAAEIESRGLLVYGNGTPPLAFRQWLRDEAELHIKRCIPLNGQTDR